MADLQKFVQAQSFSLNGSGAIIGSTSVTLKSFFGIDGVALTMTDFGNKGFITLEPGNGAYEEQISFSGVTQNANGTATLTGVKSVIFIDPYTETSGLAKTHAGSTEAVISNTAGFYAELASKVNDETISGEWVFTLLPRSNGGNATDGNQLVTYAQALALATGTAAIDRVVVAGVAGETVAAGNLLFLAVGVGGQWFKADADTASTVDNIILGIAQGAGTVGNTITSGVLIYGLDSNQTGLTNNTVYYVSNTAGAISSTPGTTEVTVGASRSTTSLLFDPRYNQQLTEDQQDALVGTSGTPSTSNRYVTNDDTAAAATANKLARRNATGDVTVPTTPTSSTDAASKAYVDALGVPPSFQYIGDTNTNILGMASDSTGANMYMARYNGTNQFTLVRFAQDTTTKQYYFAENAPAFVIGGASIGTTTNCGIAVVGSFVYVVTGAYVTRFASTNIAAGGTAMTISGTAPTGTSNQPMFTNGTDLIICNNASTTWYRYTISGTTITNAATLTGPAARTGAWSDGSFAYFVDGNTFEKWPLTLGSVTTSKSGRTDAGAGASIRSLGLGYASTASCYLGVLVNSTTSSIGLTPISKP